MHDTTLDLRQIWKTLRKRRGLIGKTFLVFVVLAAVISFLIPPTYEGELLLRVKQPKGLANSLLGDITGGSPMMTKQLMSTYAEVPAQLIDIVQGVIFLFFAAEQFLAKYRQKLVVRTAQEELAKKAAASQEGGAVNA